MSYHQVPTSDLSAPQPLSTRQMTNKVTIPTTLRIFPFQILMIDFDKLIACLSSSAFATILCSRPHLRGSVRNSRHTLDCEPVATQHFSPPIQRLRLRSVFSVSFEISCRRAYASSSNVFARFAFLLTTALISSQTLPLNTTSH